MKKTATATGKNQTKTSQTDVGTDADEADDDIVDISDIASDDIIAKVLPLSDDFDVYVDPDEDEDPLVSTPYAAGEDEEDYY